jgi:hypothetical protein
LEIDASGTVGKKPVRLIGNTSNYLIEMSDVDSAVTYGFNMDGGFSGDIEGKVLGIGASTITGTGVQAQLPNAAISIDTFTGTIKTLWENFIAMITGSGVTAAFTAKAVENVATAGLTPEQVTEISESVADEVVAQIGTSSVNVLPAVGIVADRSPGVSLTPVVGETILQSITLYATDGTTPVSLAGKTLAIPFETMSGTDVAVIANANITVSGASSNVVTFAYPSAVTASERTLRFAIKDDAAPLTEYLKGICVVTSGPRVDA